MLFLVSVLASAAGTPPADVITVTATKRESVLNEVPASVFVTTEDAVGGLAGLSFGEDLADRIPGLEVAVANGTQSVFQIRGIGAVDHQALTPGGAAVYIDNVFLASNVQTGQLLFDLDRVEVLKGPQGTLYGRNASSGAVHILSNRPGQDVPQYIRVRAGSDNLLDIEGALEHPLSANTSFRIAGRHRQQDSQLDNVSTSELFPVGNDDAGGVLDRTALRASLLHTINERSEVLVRAHVDLDRGINAAPRNSSLDVDDHEISIGPDGIQETDTALYGVSLNWSGYIGDWALTSHTAFEGYDQNYGFDFDGTPAPFDIGSLNANLRYDREFAQWSEELNASRSFGAHDLLVGISFSTDTFEQDYLIWCGNLNEETLQGDCPYVGTPGRVGPTPASDATPVSLLTRIAQDRRTGAVFAQSDIALSPATALTIGGRITYERIDGEGFGLHIFDDGVRAFNDRDGLGDAIGSNRIEETRGTYRAALRHTVSDALTVWGAVGTGYKSGGFNGEVANNATHFDDEGLFGAEDVTAYELGLRGTVGTAQYSITAFHQDYDAPQARIFVSFPQPDGSVITSNSLSNLDAAVSRGIEFDGTWEPFDSLAIRAGLTLLDTKIEQGDDGDTGNAALFDGNPLPFAPDVSASVGVQHTIPLANEAAIVIDANARYRSDFFLDAEGRDDREQEAYTLVDASLVWVNAVPNVDLGIRGRNLTDEDYAVSGFGFIGYNTFRSAPRTISAEVNFRF